MNEDAPIPTQQDLSPALVAQRAEELAVSDGRTAAETTDADYARARAELAPPAATEQVNPEPVDGFRRADVAMASSGTQALSGYEDDAQIGAHLVEEGIQAAVHDEFVAGGRETLAQAAEEEPEEELEPATFTEPAVAPAKAKAPAPSAPAAKKPAPKKAAKKVSPPAPKKAKPKKATKAKAKTKPAPKRAVKKTAKKAAKKPAKKVLKAKPKAKAAKSKAKIKAKPKKASPKKSKPKAKRKR